MVEFQKRRRNYISSCQNTNLKNLNVDVNSYNDQILEKPRKFKAQKESVIAQGTRIRRNGLWRALVLWVLLLQPQVCLSINTVLEDVPPNIPEYEISALHDLYQSTNGAEWDWKAGAGNKWNFSAVPSPNPCADLWQGITCTQNETAGYLNVLQLRLPQYSLLGFLPSSIGNLSELQYVDLSQNQLTGEIPESVGQLQLLNVLDLDSNYLTGRIPDTLGQLAELNVLLLYINNISGSIPETIGQLTNLTVLDLDSNILTSSIPESLGQLAKLTALSLYRNLLTGWIPTSLGDLMQLNVVALDVNYLSGSIPDALGQLIQLVGLDLNENLLTGTLPKFLFSGVSSSLLVFEGGHNLFRGSIPDVLVNTLPILVMNLRGNRLTGNIPSSLVASLHKIVQIYLSDNQFTGNIPQNWSSTTHLLHMQANHLTGSIPESLGRLPLLQSLNLSSNHLTGSIPASFQQLSRLQVLTLQDNQLSGNLDLLFDQLQRNLSVVQLSGNQLTGTVPAAAFQLPSLTSFAAVDNCLEGPLPVDAICSSATLQSLVLDGLHSASSCNTNPLFSGAFKLGTLPTCLFQLPNLTTLHLSGSGLTGSLPADATISQTLVDLSLSHNLLTGKVPASILGRDWVNLDLSYNRLTGTLSSARGAPYGNATQLSLQHNRLSGVIPGSIQRVGTLFLLDSNMFSCQADHSNLPPQDTESSKYTCGSDAVNNALYVWLGLVVVLVTAGCLAIYRGFSALYSVGDWLRAAGQLPSMKRTLEVSQALCILGVGAAAYCVLLLLPLFAVVGSHYGTFTYKYAWTLSGVFLSGSTAFGFEATFLLLLLLILTACLALSHKLLNGAQYAPMTRFAGAAHKAENIQCKTFDVLFTLFCLGIVVCINVGFVIATLNLSGKELTIIQVLLAVFKLSFNIYVAPVMQKGFRTVTSGESHNSIQSPSFTTSQLLLVLLNVFVIPCFVVMVISPVCFYDAIKGSEEVTSAYSYSGTCAFLLIETENGVITGLSCLERSIVSTLTSYSAPFTYSYQCSSSFITYYAPTFVAMCVISGFLVPMQRLFLLWLRSQLSPTSRLRKWVTAATPRILRELQSAEDLARYRRDPLKRPLFSANQLLLSLLTYLALLLTFGALFPPLAVCCAVAMASVALTARLEVGYYVTAATTANRQDCLKEIEYGCVDVASPQQIQAALCVILTISCMFYTLFLFDTLGDAVGFADAFWVLIVVPVLPVLPMLARAIMMRVGWPTTRRSGDSAAATPALDTENPALAVELPVIPAAEAEKVSTGKDSIAAENPMHITEEEG